MSEMTEFDVESFVSRIQFVFVLSTKSRWEVFINISAIYLGVSAVVSSVFMETSSGMLRVLEFVLRNDHGRLGLDLKSMFAVAKNLCLLSLSISLICFKGVFFNLFFICIFGVQTV